MAGIRPFRRRVRDSELITQSFANPATLGQLVERSLRDLAETRRRIDSGIQREQVPAEPQTVRASKLVNPPPAMAPTWFQDRQVETGLLARYVTDPGIRMVSVAGRGGKRCNAYRELRQLRPEWLGRDWCGYLCVTDSARRAAA